MLKRDWARVSEQLKTRAPTGELSSDGSRIGRVF